MAVVTNLHLISGVGVGATILGGITAQDLALEHELGGEAKSGELYARYQALYSQKYTPGFTTEDVAAALGACGATGLSLATSALALHAIKQADGGNVAAGGVHRSYTFSKGILFPKLLTCEHQGDASISYGAVVISADGSTSPLVIGETATVPAITIHSAHTLGAIAIGAKSLTHCKKLEIEFGLECVSEGADSDILDTFATLRAVVTEIRLSGIDTTWLKSDTVPESGLVGTHANTTIYLRKRAAGGTFVADATAEHIKFTAAGLAVIDKALGGNPNEVDLRMPLSYDGTNAPLTISAASAIT